MDGGGGVGGVGGKGQGEVKAGEQRGNGNREERWKGGICWGVLLYTSIVISFFYS